MVPFWWVAVALLGGAGAGILIMAMLQVAGGIPEDNAISADLNEMPR